jgi:hypothetical protein
MSARALQIFHKVTAFSPFTQKQLLRRFKAKQGAGGERERCIYMYNITAPSFTAQIFNSTRKHVKDLMRVSSP